MIQPYFSELMPVLAERAKLSSTGILGFANVPLQRHLFEVFSRPFGEKGSFLADPTFEAVFGWKTGDYKMRELAGNLLSPALVNAMDNPPKELKKDYRFAKDLKPYRHQIEAWKILAEKEPKSLIVASGTGSGKTECFMVPILDALVRQQEKIRGKLVGVEAIFLYPLNALINSQRDRFRAWTNAFEGNIRFCLYNGNTPERPEPSRIQNEYPSEILDRTTLRKTPPSLLVTNATMLEYMLVRTADAPIISQSNGKLKWIVLDEAHTYVGSQAAEAALLIRRVLLAFGVKPEQVRFIATSATIGDPEGKAGIKLKRFLADVAGVDLENVHLVTGQREIPAISVQPDDSSENISELINFEENREGELFDKLVKNKTARQIRRLFVGNPENPSVATLSEICKVIFPNGEKSKTKQFQEALQWLDALSQAESKPLTDKEEKEPFLPLRGHIFHQTLSGIWACADSDCSKKTGTPLDDENWSFGKIFFEPRKNCDCGSPVYEVVKCDECAEVHLKAEVDSNGKIVHPQPKNALDEFELETDAEDSNEDQPEEDSTMATATQYQVLIVNRKLKRAGSLYIDRQTRQRLYEPSDDSLTVQAFEDGGQGLICPACEKQENIDKRIFRASRIGAPYLLGGILPTLLEYAPDGENPGEAVCRGRRLLSFNDSRQGTARIAAKLQQEAERNRIRGLIYHLALREREKGKSLEIEELQEKIKQMESFVTSDLPDSAKEFLEKELQENKEKLSAISQPNPISFNELADNLTRQGRDFDQMLKQYRRYAPSVFSDAVGQLGLAKMFIVREFGRRPKRMNNLETMGLMAVQYPALEKIKEVPSMVVQAANFDLKEWRDFLKLCLDFGVRNRGALEISSTWRNWLGMKYPQKALVPHDFDFPGAKQFRWLRANQKGRRGNLVKLLMYVLKADISTSEGEDRINTVLDYAWSDLIFAGLLTQTSDGRMLNLNQLAFINTDFAWVCPVTRRFLDTTLRGITPYLPENSGEKTALCERVKIPLYNEAFAGDNDIERIKKGRKWLSEQNEIIKFREQGLWASPNDRVIELSQYFTTAEHSAQQDSMKLQRYEKNFKEGKLNLLSCSTTMEMGIDIGGISLVAMNNVPPHPSNYLQRAGRAGRRRETRSAAVTLCKSNPHDQSVFSNTRWAFDSILPAPGVSLDSSVIVERHINSYLLAKFFARYFTELKEESIKLTCGRFFLGETSLSDRYAAWCRSFKSKSFDDIEDGLSHLVKNSILEGVHFKQILDKSAESVEIISTKWMVEYNQLEAEEIEFLESGGEKSPPMRAIELRKTRLTDEYLLKELSTRGFLPAYGFPTNITPFDNLTVQQFIKNKQSRDREDNRFRRRELASRDIITALREYAPGSEVIMDGLVYVSAGVTLNWQIPAHIEQVREIQNIRFVWRCHQCGSSGSSSLLNTTQTCKDCGTAIKVQEFLEPSGFAVDFYKDAGNDVTSQRFVPVENPWIDAEGEWFPLLNPDLGRFRVTTDGHVFHQSRGIHGKGYAVCLECGRAEPMLPDDSLPSVFKDADHKKLRRMSDEGSFCPGSRNNWKIKEEIILGHETRTDIFELQLKDTKGVWLKDPIIALTLAVVLRDSLAELLGVQAVELGCDTKQARNSDGGICQSILIFDRYAAGYASSANRFLDELFTKAADHLDCLQNCDSVCPHCVLDYDQRFSANNLDRKKAAEFLTQEWLDSFKIPETLAFFGESSAFEYSQIFESVLLAVAKDKCRKLRFFTSGNSADWDIAPSNLREIVYQLAGRNISVEIMIEKEIIKNLNIEDRFLLSSLADHPLVDLSELDFSPRIEEGWVLAEAIGANSVRWAVPHQNSLFFSSEWGVSDFLIKSQKSRVFSTSGEIINPHEIRPELIKSGDKELEIKTELDGKLQGFGKRFWNFIKKNHSETQELFDNQSEKLLSVAYTDRYLYSPLTVALLYQIINSLKTVMSEVEPTKFSFELITTRNTNFHYSQQNHIKYDWVDSDTRDRVIKLVFDQNEIDFSLNIKPKTNISHGRFLEMNFSSGKSLILRLDQGISYWKPAWAMRSDIVHFDFFASDYQQRQRILTLSNEVIGADFPTQIFIKVASI